MRWGSGPQLTAILEDKPAEAQALFAKQSDRRKPIVMRVHCLPPRFHESQKLRAILHAICSGSACATAEALRSKASREKGQQHDLCCPRDRVVGGGKSRADCASRLPPTTTVPLRQKTTPARRDSPSRFNFHIRVWCQIVGDSPRKGDHAGASPVTLTSFVAVSSNQ